MSFIVGDEAKLNIIFKNKEGYFLPYQYCFLILKVVQFYVSLYPIINKNVVKVIMSLSVSKVISFYFYYYYCYDNIFFQLNY